MISFLSSEVHINQAKIVTLKTSDINMTSEVCCVIWIINKRAHCVQQIDSKARKALCTSENFQKYYCLEKNGSNRPTIECRVYDWGWERSRGGQISQEKQTVAVYPHRWVMYYGLHLVNLNYNFLFRRMSKLKLFKSIFSFQWSV